MIATGRSYNDCKKIISEIGLFDNGGILAFSDGQYLIDYQDGEKQTFDFLNHPNDTMNIKRLINKGDCAMSLYTEDKIYNLYDSKR